MTPYYNFDVPIYMLRWEPLLGVMYEMKDVFVARYSYIYWCSYYTLQNMRALKSVCARDEERGVP